MMTFLINIFFVASFLPIGITFFHMQLRNHRVALIPFIFGVLLCSFVEIIVTHSSPVLFPLSFLCIFFTLFAIFNSTFKRILLCELLSYFSITLLYQVIGSICSQLPIEISANSTILSLIKGIITFLIVFLFSNFIVLKFRCKDYIPLSYLLFFTAVSIIDCTIIIAIGIFLFKKMGITNITLAVTIYFLLIICIFVQIGLLIHMIKSRDLHKENELLARQYLENQTRYYEYLVQREEDTRKFRHDIRNHISMLNMLFQESKIDECRDYLQDLTAHYENIHNAISVNNCIADAILNKYYYEAQNHGIELTVTGHFPSECNLPAYDICTIFSNLLENALKAVIDCDGKDISVGCRYTDTEILLSIENDSDYVELDADGMPRTSKNDVSQHGFGLKNVQQCVRQNNGHMSIQTNDKRFKVILSLSRGNDNESCNNR